MSSRPRDVGGNTEVKDGDTDEKYKCKADYDGGTMCKRIVWVKWAM